MGSEWPTATIEELAEKVAMGPFGSSIKVETFVSSGVPIISGQHLHGYRLNEESGFNYVSEEHAAKLANANVFPGDVVFTHAGSIGQAAYIPETAAYERYVISQRQFYMRCKRDRILPEYVTYYFSSPQGQHALLANSTSVGVPSIARPATYLRSIRIPVPPLSTQQAIAAILGALDDKIELNRKMSQTLEATVEALFRSRFVEFAGQSIDPQSGVPRGWRIVPFSESVSILSGGTPKTSIDDYWGGEIPWFAIADAPESGGVFVLGTAKNTTPLGIANSAAQVLPAGTTILTARGTVGLRAIAGVDMAINQSCFGLRGRHPHSDYYTYAATGLVVDRLRQYSHGSVFSTINRSTFTSVPVIDPPVEEILDYERTVKPLMERIRLNGLESRALRTLRDTLLPRLLSGELRADA